ncbi:MAG TPA: hypothetical protein VLJ58_22140 [Ramlibacter sp.]|nr:hypothetical protein [Ramlibacter sp.]
MTEAEREMKMAGCESPGDLEILRQLRHAESVLLDYALLLIAQEPEQDPQQEEPEPSAPLDWFSSLPPGRVLRALWAD